MKKFALLLLGVFLGYWLGFQDAQTHEGNLITRTVHRVGGEHRANMVTDVDQQMRNLESR
jgi:hypothetical protein